MRVTQICGGNVQLEMFNWSVTASNTLSKQRHVITDVQTQFPVKSTEPPTDHMSPDTRASDGPNMYEAEIMFISSTVDVPLRSNEHVLDCVPLKTSGNTSCIVYLYDSGHL